MCISSPTRSYNGRKCGSENHCPGASVALNACPYSYGRPYRCMCGVLHIPYRYAFTVTTALRFVPIFLQEMTKIKKHRRLAALNLTPKSLSPAQIATSFIVPLIVSSVKKSRPTALSAEQRGFFCVQESPHLSAIHAIL